LFPAKHQLATCFLFDHICHLHRCAAFSLENPVVALPPKFARLLAFFNDLVVQTPTATGAQIFLTNYEGAFPEEVSCALKVSKAQLTEVLVWPCPLLICNIAAVEILSFSINQVKNLHFGGALAFQKKISAAVALLVDPSMDPSYFTIHCFS